MITVKNILIVGVRRPRRTQRVQHAPLGLVNDLIALKELGESFMVN